MIVLNADFPNTLTIKNLEPVKQTLMLCSADIIVFESPGAIHGLLFAVLCSGFFQPMR